MRIEDIINQFTNVKQEGSQYICNCLKCGDDHHLYLTQKDDKVLMYCQKCGAGFRDIIRYLNLPKNESRPPPVEQYDHIYKNPDGTVAYYKTRTKYADGKKKFVFYHCIGRTKIYKKPDNCNALYNLDLLAKADKGERLYIVEGEKCADIMVKQGFLATTTNTGGGNEYIKFSKTDIEMLKSFTDKTVIPDNDETGRKYAAKFPQTKILNLADIWREIKPKQDIYDYIAAGKSLDLIKNYNFNKKMGDDSLNEKPYGELTREELISAGLYERLQSINDNFQRSQAVTACQNRARELKISNDFNRNFKEYKIAAANKKKSTGNGNKTGFTGQSLELECGEWECDDSGVRMSDVSANGDVSVKYCSPIPILPTEIMMNKDTGIEKLRLEFNKDGWRHVICERAVTASSTKIIELANKGVEVNSENAKLLVRYIADIVQYNLDALPQSAAVSRLGWVDGGFMPYCEGVKFDGEKDYRYLFEAVRQKGSLEEWSAFMQPLRKNRECK